MVLNKVSGIEGQELAVIELANSPELQAAEGEVEQRGRLIEQLQTRIAALEEDVHSSSSLVSSLLEKGKSVQEKCQTLVREPSFY
jgi:hypothetical protein